MCDDQDLGDGPGPMTFGRFMALAVGASVIFAFALIGFWTVIS